MPNMKKLKIRSAFEEELGLRRFMRRASYFPVFPYKLLFFDAMLLLLFPIANIAYLTNSVLDSSSVFFYY